jgi:hypothetical protein
VLSAVEGLKVEKQRLRAAGAAAGAGHPGRLFLLQSRGTHKIGGCSAGDGVVVLALAGSACAR